MIPQTVKNLLRKIGITQEGKIGRLWKSIRLSEKLTKRLHFAELANSYTIMKHLDVERSNDKELLSLFICSFDRAFQLDALLGSIVDNVFDANKYKIPVLYRYSTQEHQKAYSEMFSRHTTLNLTPILQSSGTSFREQALATIQGMTSKKLIILVDDMLIIEKVNLDEFALLPSDVYIPSLRLGSNITYSYAADMNIELPHFLDKMTIPEQKSFKDHIHVWQWKTGVRHWRRPLSVDGNIFDRREYLYLMQNVDFKNPNTLEDTIASSFDEFYKHKLGICYEKAKVVNLPINNVNQIYDKTFDNRYGTIHQDNLLTLWQQGQQMDYKALYGYKNRGVHEEIPFQTIKREN